VISNQHARQNDQRISCANGGDIVTDTLKLKIAILRSGLSYKEIAEKLGIRKETLSKKVNNKAEFRTSEMTVLIDILRLEEKEEECDRVREIFLT
jgi:transcriptional regulator with XRE-family HTH domain